MDEMLPVARIEVVGTHDLDFRVYMELAPYFPMECLPHFINCIESIIPKLKSTYKSQTGRDDIDSILKSLKSRTDINYKEIVRNPEELITESETSH